MGEWDVFINILNEAAIFYTRLKLLCILQDLQDNMKISGILLIWKT